MIVLKTMDYLNLGQTFIIYVPYWFIIECFLDFGVYANVP